MDHARISVHDEDSEGGIEKPEGGHVINLPDEILIKIFSGLQERDLCSLSRTCKRFNILASDGLLWKRAFQDLFEYDLPLFNPEPLVFQFKEPEESGYDNPWKESYRQLYRGFHVYPVENKPECIQLRYQRKVLGPRPGLIQFKSLGQAVLHYGSENSDYDGYNVFFVHPGNYEARETVFMCPDVAIIGAGRGNVAENVVFYVRGWLMEGDVSPPQSQQNAYLGYVSVRPFHEGQTYHLFISSSENCSSFTAVVDHCLIGPIGDVSQTLERSSVATGVFVSGNRARAIVRNCVIRNCQQGIDVRDTTCVVEDCDIAGNREGLSLDFDPECIIRHNKIHHNSRHIQVFDVLAHPESGRSKVTIVRNKLFCGEDEGILIGKSTGVSIEENEFSKNNRKDVRVKDDSRAVLRRNVFNGPHHVVFVQEGSEITAEDNQFIH